MAIGFKYDSIFKLFTPIRKRIQYNQIDLQITTIPNGSSTERFQTETYELLDQKYKEHIDGSRKDGRVACAIVASECKEREEE
jgi:hypothetical protein